MPYNIYGEEKIYFENGGLIAEYSSDDDQITYYSFDKLNGTKEDLLDKTLNELYEHMRAFSRANGIDTYCQNATIRFNR